MARERTLVILKPDAVEQGLAQIIIHHFTRVGLTVTADKYVSKSTNEQLDKHFPHNEQWVTDMGIRACQRIEDPASRFGTDNAYEIGQMIIQGCRDYYLSGPLVAMVLEGEGAVQKVRKLIGSALPSQAEKGTIRGDLGTPEDPESIIATRNLIHASDSVEEAEREIPVWFTEEELSL